jgi:hypothetical protein
MSGFVGDTVRALPGAWSLVLPLCDEVRRIGVLQAVARALLAAQVFFLAVVLGAGKVGMGGDVALLIRDLL